MESELASDDGIGWTVQTLKAHFEQRFADQEKAVSAALASAEKAVAAALAAAEKAREQAQADAMAWRSSANEWRGSMLDREAKFASRLEMEAELKAIGTQLQTLKEHEAGQSGGKTVMDTSRSNLAVLVSLLALVAMLVKTLLGK